MEVYLSHAHEHKHPERAILQWLATYHDVPLSELTEHVYFTRRIRAQSRVRRRQRHELNGAGRAANFGTNETSRTYRVRGQHHGQ